MYELVAGAHRFRASKLAGKSTIPGTVRKLTDAEAQEIRLIENLQRTNIHELDEGIGYRSLMDLRPDFYTVETIAAQVAKSPAYIRGRISLTELIQTAQTAFYQGKLTVAHALEIARLQPHDQERALMECFPGHRNAGSILKDRKAEALTVRQLRDWIEREIHLDLKSAPFDTEDANLLPAAGACSTCPKRTGNNPLLFPEIKKSFTMHGSELPPNEGPEICRTACCAIGERWTKASPDFGEPFLAGLHQSSRHAVRGSISPCGARRRMSSYSSRCDCGRPQSRNDHARLHGREVQDASPILPL